MKNPAELAFVDQLLGKGDGRHAAVIVPDHVWHLGLLDGVHHLRGFFGRTAQRLFAHHHLAGLCGGNGDFVMGVIGAGDIDDVDILALNQFAPIGFD